jgi:hypothetical protein
VQGQVLSKRNDRQPAPEKAAYQATEREKAALARVQAAMSQAPRAKVIQGKKGSTIVPDHPDELYGYTLLMDALGTTSIDFVIGLLTQLANVGSSGREIDEGGLNFMLSVVRGIQPRDQIEAMLAAQAAAIHLTIMKFTRRLAGVETLEQQDSAERALNKLARTFTSQIDALKRYRTGGEQKVTVHHVSVNEGGQAIVGHVTHTARGPSPDSKPEPSDARQPETPIIEEPKGAQVQMRRSRRDVRRSST